jgi:hypothetical protein
MSRRLGSTRHVPERVIDTWYYKVKDVEIERNEYIEPEDGDHGHDEREDHEKHVVKGERIVNKTVKIELILHKKTSQSEEPPHPTESVEFEVKCEELKLNMTGTDIEALRAGMWDQLDAKFDIKWEQFYLVTVSPTRGWNGAAGTGILFEYDNVWRGTTWDGKLLMKKYDSHEFKIKPWPGEFTDKGGKVIACIPVNEMNTLALQNFSDRMDKMREVMADFLRPEKIMQTLADLSGHLPFLPAPSTTEEKSDHPAAVKGVLRHEYTEEERD